MSVLQYAKHECSPFVDNCCPPCKCPTIHCGFVERHRRVIVFLLVFLAGMGLFAAIPVVPTFVLQDLGYSNGVVFGYLGGVLLVYTCMACGVCVYGSYDNLVHRYTVFKAQLLTPDAGNDRALRTTEV